MTLANLNIHACAVGTEASVAKKGDLSVAGAIVTDQLLLASVDTGREQRRDGIRNVPGRAGGNQGPV